MAYGLPALGETGWKTKLDASIEAVKATADAALPAGQSSVDAAMAGRVNDPTSSTRAALNARFAPNRATDGGAMKDDTADDAPAIQSLINTVRDTVRAGFNANNVVRLPAGVYKIGSTITLPPYVKLHLEGSVTFRYTGAGTALHVTPLADDPASLYAQFAKQQWTNAPMFQGGGLIIVGAGAATNSGHVGTGLEVGSRTDLGSSRPAKGYRIGHVSIAGFTTGLRLNTFNHYLGSFDNLHIELNVVGIAVGTTGTPNVNSGENFSFEHCVVAGASSAIEINAPGWDLALMSTSIDYCDRAATIHNGYGSLNFLGGHVEAITPETSAPLYGAAAGGVIVSDATDGPADVAFSRTTFLVEAAAPLFRGSSLSVAGTVLRRPVGGSVPDGLVAVATGVNGADLHDALRARERRIVTEQHNRILDPRFASEATGNTGALVNWDVAYNDGATYQVVASGYGGGKGLRVTLPAGTTVVFITRDELAFRGPNERMMTLVVKPTNVGANCFTRLFTIDRSGVATAAPDVPMGTTALSPGDWRTPLYLTDTLPAMEIGKARGARPAFGISNPTGSTVVIDVGYVYFGE